MAKNPHVSHTRFTRRGLVYRAKTLHYLVFRAGNNKLCKRASVYLTAQVKQISRLVACHDVILRLVEQGRHASK